MLLLGVGALVLTSGTARAEGLEVNVPFPFVVGDRTLPAGEYRVERASDNPSVLVISGEQKHRTSAIVLTGPAAGHDPAGDKPVLTFTRSEKDYRLTGVWESADEGHTVAGS
jgi:hypothetical protein